MIFLVDVKDKVKSDSRPITTLYDEALSDKLEQCNYDVQFG